jgi:hypothetical protein
MSADTDLRDVIVAAWLEAGVYTNEPMNDVADIALKVIKDWTADEPSIPFRKIFKLDAESIRMRKLTDIIAFARSLESEPPMSPEDAAKLYQDRFNL